MQLRFATEQTTQIRFFESAEALEKELAARVGFALLDSGASVKIPLQVSRRDLPAGERCKRWDELGACLTWLAEHGAERSALLAGVGGGAALDLAGLTASLYRRGMPLVLVPTTLLAMVDAAVGGKTAVDDESTGVLRKNFAGSFYPAAEVWICADYLHSLPRRERLSGAGECFKTLWIVGEAGPQPALLNFVNGAPADGTLALVIKKCLKEKVRVVEGDPLDTLRKREVLNYGHTVGHALESAAEGRIAHGECVLWGMWLESLFLGEGAAAQAQLTGNTLKDLQLPMPEEITKSRDWEALFKADKKTKDGKIEMSILTAPGEVRQIRSSPEQLGNFLRSFARAFDPK